MVICLEFPPFLHCLGGKILSRPIATSYQILESCWKKITYSRIQRYLKFSVSFFQAVRLWVELEKKVRQLQPLFFNPQMLYQTLALMVRDLMFNPQNRKYSLDDHMLFQRRWLDHSHQNYLSYCRRFSTTSPMLLSKLS